MFSRPRPIYGCFCLVNPLLFSLSYLTPPLCGHDTGPLLRGRPSRRSVPRSRPVVPPSPLSPERTGPFRTLTGVVNDHPRPISVYSWCFVYNSKRTRNTCRVIQTLWTRKWNIFKRPSSLVPNYRLSCTGRGPTVSRVRGEVVQSLVYGVRSYRPGGPTSYRPQGHLSPEPTKLS